MALTGHVTTVQELGEPAPIPQAEPQQQGPNTPGKHWKADLDKVGRRREKITRPEPGTPGSSKTDLAGADAAAPLLSSDIRSKIYRHQTGT